MKLHILFYFVVFESIICASSATKENVVKNMGKVSILTTVNKKFDNFNRKIDKMETNNAKEMNKLKSNMTKLMKYSDKISKLLTQLLQAETNREMNVSSDENDVMKILASQFSSLFDSKVMPMVNEMSNQIKETLEKQLNASANEIDALKEMPSRFSSTCESKVKPIVTHVNHMNDRLTQTSDKANTCINNVNNMNVRLTETLNKANICVNKANNILVPLEIKYAKFICDKAKKCFQRVDTAYVVIEKSVSWYKANENCIKEGMTLAMPKDRDSTEFAVKELKAMYPHHYRFWIGLVSDMKDKKWRWIDGSVVQHYTGGHDYTGGVIIDNFCGLFQMLPINQYWDDYSCSNSYYGLCEKRIYIP